MKFILFLIATFLFVITIYHVRLIAVGGVYPSKYILKRRVSILAIGCILIAIIGLVVAS